MKICLIIPPSAFLLDERVFMSLGILKIAAVLERDKIDVDVLDLSGITNYEEVVTDYCSRTRITTFGITTTTPQLPASINILRAIKTVLPDSRIILGGPHVTLINAAYKREEKLGIAGRATKSQNQLVRDFDVLVAGDGEEAIFEALKKDTLPLIDADIPKTNLFLTSRRLEELPFPARHLIDVESYSHYIDGIKALNIIAQLGCPFQCGFCGGRSSPSLRMIRTRTSENIVSEMVHVYKTYRVCGFMMHDDELNVNKNMVTLMKQIKQAQINLGVEFRLRGFIKAELFTDEQAEAMYQAGFRWILVGFESGSPRILENINKKSTRDENTQCVKIAQKHGLKVKALMSIGHPGESEQTALETQAWLLESRPDDFDITIITVYPGTPYYDEAVPSSNYPDVWVYTYAKTGDKLYSKEVDYRITSDYYKGDPDNGYVSYVYTDYMTSEQLVTVRDSIERSVRRKLNIPFNASRASVHYEHSMGQGLVIPPHILRSTNPKPGL